MLQFVLIEILCHQFENRGKKTHTQREKKYEIMFKSIYSNKIKFNTIKILWTFALIFIGLIWKSNILSNRLREMEYVFCECPYWTISAVEKIEKLRISIVTHTT